MKKAAVYNMQDNWLGTVEGGENVAMSFRTPEGSAKRKMDGWVDTNNYWLFKKPGHYLATPDIN